MSTQCLRQLIFLKVFHLSEYDFFEIALGSANLNNNKIIVLIHSKVVYFSII